MKNVDWFDDAACLGTDTESFFPPERGCIPAVVKRICAGCPVQAECLDYSMTFVPVLEGVWGGLGQKQRELLKSRRLRHAG